MASVPTFEELYAAYEAEARRRAPQLRDWSEGSALDGLAGGGAMLADHVIGFALDRFRALFFGTAVGDELDELARDRFEGLTREQEAASIGTLTFTRGSYVGAYTIEAGFEVQAEVDGEVVVVATDSDVVMSAAASTVDAAATCLTAGRIGNVPENELTEPVSPHPLDTDLTVTNAERFAGGRAEATDQEFLAAIRRFTSTFARGTVAAVLQGAMDTPGVSFATVDESTAPPSSGGYVSVFVGDPDGAGNAALAAAAQPYVDAVRPAGVEHRALPAAREEVVLQLRVVTRRNADRDAVRAAVRANVLDYTDNLEPGETLYLSEAEHRCHEASPVVVSAAVTSHTADIEPTAGSNALRVSSGELTVTIVERSS